MEIASRKNRETVLSPDAVRLAGWEKPASLLDHARLTPGRTVPPTERGRYSGIEIGGCVGT